MSSSENSLQGIKTDAFQTQKYDSIDSKHNIVAHQNPRKLRGDENFNYFEDQEAMELFSRVKAQKEEIRVLREQISTACVKEMQLLNEKYALERKFSDLRMAIDENQNEAISSALNELVRRKSDLEENLRLAHELKVIDDERYIFMSSMLGLLAEYGIWPRVINASAISNSVKSLHDQLQWKIRVSHDSTRELASVEGARMNRESQDKIRSGMIAQGPHQSTDLHGISTNPHAEENHFETTDNILRYNYENEFTDKRSLMYNGNMHPKLNENNFQDFSFIPERNATVSSANSLFDNGFANAKTNAREMTKDTVHPISTHADIASSVSDEGPGIEGFQIIGDATPGEKLLGCGYPVRGTSLCMFQWVRHLEDGTRQYIEGATNPEYVVTADDVDKLIAVECIPMDDQGRQGELVRLFANDQNKITCDPEMQKEIDMYLTKGEAAFSILLLTDSPDKWEPTTLILKLSGYQIRSNISDTVVVGEKFSKDLAIKIPSVLSTQLVLACPNGSYHPLRTYDVRMRDTLVLTMRMFQKKTEAMKPKLRELTEERKDREMRRYSCCLVSLFNHYIYMAVDDKRKGRT